MDALLGCSIGESTKGLGAVYMSLGWLQPAAEGLLFFSYIFSSVCMDLVASPSQPALAGNPCRRYGWPAESGRHFVESFQVKESQFNPGSYKRFE